MTFKRYALLALLALVLAQDVISQNAGEFNKIYTKTFLEVAPKSIDSALIIADSLYRASTQPLFQAKSLMLSASLYQQKEDLKRAIQLAEKADAIIDQTEDYNWRVRIAGFLSTQYRTVQLYNKSRSYTDKALRMIPKIENPEMANSTMGLMNQELAYYYIAVKDYKQSIEHINTAQQHFALTRQDKDFFTANNEQLLGLNYYYLKNFDASLAHYKKALLVSAGKPANYITGLTYSGMAAVLIEKDSLKDAKKYLDKAETIAKSSQYLQLKNEIYKTSQTYYARAKDIKRLEDARQKQDTVANQILSKTTTFLDENYAQLEKKQQAAEQKSNAKNIYLLSGAILITACIIFFIVYRNKQKKQVARFKAVLEHLKNRQTLTTAGSSVKVIVTPQEQVAVVVNDLQEAVKESQLMTAQTEDKIVLGLKDFEASDLYLNNNLSLSALASHLNTNTKYLSYIINNYKNTDFNNYINTLRINYIIDKLNTNPEWLQYKISVLAEAAGFSSHSKFATVFKTLTGLSPSSFIQYLKEDKKRLF